jgi:hypothetical protein
MRFARAQARNLTLTPSRTIMPMLKFKQIKAMHGMRKISKPKAKVH